MIGHPLAPYRIAVVSVQKQAIRGDTVECLLYATALQYDTGDTIDTIMLETTQ
jgi:hypothetical protein